MLRHYAPRFHRILEALRVELCNSTPRFASALEQGNENIKYSIFSNGNWTYYLRVYSQPLLPLRHNWPDFWSYYLWNKSHRVYSVKELYVILQQVSGYARIINFPVIMYLSVHFSLLFIAITVLLFLSWFNIILPTTRHLHTLVGRV